MVEFSAEAVADLINIREYIAQNNPETAARIAAMIRQKSQLLNTSPLAGRPGRERGTRELSTAKPWVIVYEITTDGPYVLRIWHGRQSRK
jgi:toxin ParE1/3/4